MAGHACTPTEACSATGVRGRVSERFQRMIASVGVYTWLSCWHGSIEDSLASWTPSQVQDITQFTLTGILRGGLPQIFHLTRNLRVYPRQQASRRSRVRPPGDRSPFLSADHSGPRSGCNALAEFRVRGAPYPSERLYLITVLPALDLSFLRWYDVRSKSVVYREFHGAACLGSLT